VKKAMETILRWWKEYRCDHYWRPALQTRMPHQIVPGGMSEYGMRVCDYCRKTNVLTDEEFYAQFGRMPIL
jgi:hypothetical protein